MSTVCKGGSHEALSETESRWQQQRSSMLIKEPGLPGFFIAMQQHMILETE